MILRPVANMNEFGGLIITIRSPKACHKLHTSGLPQAIDGYRKHRAVLPQSKLSLKPQKHLSVFDSLMARWNAFGSMMHC